MLAVIVYLCIFTLPMYVAECDTCNWLATVGHVSIAGSLERRVKFGMPSHDLLARKSSTCRRCTVEATTTPHQSNIFYLVAHPPHRVDAAPMSALHQ